MQAIFEAMGGTYRQEGAYLLPNLTAPGSPQIDIWGERRRRYLQDHRPGLYTGMLLGGTLNTDLEEVGTAAIEISQLRPTPIPAYQSCNPWAGGTCNDYACAA